ncbi:MAG: hypothetical protein U0894_10480 [Pirellulales bacterium]
MGSSDFGGCPDRYFEASGRRLTFEYVLLANLNDSDQNAQSLCNCFVDVRHFLNVIPYNPVAGLPYETPSANRINRFRDILMLGGVNVKFRQRVAVTLMPRVVNFAAKPPAEGQVPVVQISPK